MGLHGCSCVFMCVHVCSCVCKCVQMSAWVCMGVQVCASECMGVRDGRIKIRRPDGRTNNNFKVENLIEP